MLLAAFAARRPTRDIDLAAWDLPGEVDDVLAMVRRIAAMEVEDGLVFDPAAASATSIRDEDQYAGVRVSLPCVLASARIRFHVDVNVGDPIWPAPGPVELPRVYLLSRAHGQDGGELVTAIARVAEHRQVPLSPLATSLAGYPRLAQSRWAAWRRRQLLDGMLPEDFAEVLDAVTAFADPCLRADVASGVWDATARRWTSVGELPDSP